jgi:hypothetical protein
MANAAEMQVRFDRVISAIRALIDSLTARDAAWEELKKGTAGVYAGSAMACMSARQTFEDEMPTMEALLLALRDNHYKDPTWPADGGDDVKLLRLVWCSIHKTIETGKSFAPDDIGAMRNLCAALERARDSTLSTMTATNNRESKKTGRPKGASLSKDEKDCIRCYREGKKIGEIDDMMIQRKGSKRKNGEKWKWGTANKVIEAAKSRGEIPRKSRGKIS